MQCVSSVLDLNQEYIVCECVELVPHESGTTRLLLYHSWIERFQFLSTSSLACAREMIPRTMSTKTR
jgi:hypothetical protein